MLDINFKEELVMNETMNKMEVKTISSKASIFIIPNHATLPEESYPGSARLIHEQTEIAELNDIEYDRDEDQLVQFWIHADDIIQSENLNCHGAAIYIDDERYRIDCRCELLTERIFREHIEGDVVNLKLPAYLSKSGSDLDESEKIILDLELTLNQLDYRYRSFGPFEEVLKRVTL